MISRSLSTVAVALLLAAGATALSATSANAATCHYVGYDILGIKFFEIGRASKMSKACDRARRQCNRQLERWIKWGKMGREPKCSVLTEAGS